jgi:hypothetical protein
MITAPAKGVGIHNCLRVQGNQIGRQRHALFAMWLDNIKTDWLLWVDSDIVLTSDVLKMLWDSADKISKPVMCGVYFISKETESSLMMPMPAIFNEMGDEFRIKYLHPLPKSEIVQVDNAGLGLTLMHRNAGLALREKHGDVSMFAEIEGVGSKFIGEDIVFFRKLKAAGVKVHAHTGARVKHMKRFALDEGYYNLYWKTAAAIDQAEVGHNNGISTKK